MNKYKFYRVNMELTQVNVAKKVDCSSQMISEIERGNIKPGLTLAINLAKLFKTTVEELES